MTDSERTQDRQRDGPGGTQLGDARLGDALTDPPVVPDMSDPTAVAGAPSPGPAGTSSGGGAQSRGRDRRFGRRLIAPGVALVLLLVIFPVGVEIYISLTSWAPTRGTQWLDAYRDWQWFRNYVDALVSSPFPSTLVRTVIMTAVAVSLEFVIGFVMALLFVNRFPGHRVATVLLLLPMMIVPVVSGYIFFLMLSTQGPVNAILSWFVPGTVDISWLSDPSWTPVSVVMVDVWQWTPLMFLILLSGMLAVPEDHLKAADILGASWLQRLRMVVLPAMKGIIIIALIIRSMEAFKLFDAAWLLTQGGPGESSMTISVLLYRTAFIDARWSFAAAMAIIVMIAVSLVAFQAVKPIERAQQEAR